MTMQSLYERAVTILKKDDGGLIQNKPKTGQWFITEEAVTHVSLIMKFINFASVEPVSIHFQTCFCFICSAVPLVQLNALVREQRFVFILSSLKSQPESKTFQCLNGNRIPSS